MLKTVRIRWGAALAWVLALAGLGGLAAGYLIFVRNREARAEVPTPRSPEEPPKVSRSGEHGLDVPPEVFATLGLRTAEATRPSRPRTLPPLSGTLALDTNRLVRVHARLPGEVVSLGLHSAAP